MLSIVVPVFNEAENIGIFLRGVENAVPQAKEILVVYDFPEDNTLPAVAALDPPCAEVHLVHNTLGRGVLNALKAGLAASVGEVVIVMMADGSDDPTLVPRLAELIRGGADVAAPSRYVRGGRQEGGPWLKGVLSHLAGVSLYWLGGLPIHDATNNYRAYSQRVVRELSIESECSFVVAMELTLKAHWRSWKVVEIPCVWKERTAGASRFRLLAWMPHYLRWYLLALRHAWFGH